MFQEQGWQEGKAKREYWCDNEQRRVTLGVISPFPWSFHLSLNENILFGSQAGVVMREVYVNFIFSHNFLLGISILVFCCLLFQRHLYANMFMLIIFMFPLRLCMLHITHQGGSSLMKTFKFDFENYSEKFKPCSLPM